MVYKNKFLTQILCFISAFLEFINNILTIGIIPALFSDDEKETIMSSVRPYALESGFGVTKWVHPPSTLWIFLFYSHPVCKLLIQIYRDGVWNYFLDLCANNLHIVLAMSPSGENLRNWCRSFPGLVNNTYIDWLFPWPSQALLAVAHFFLTDVRVNLPLIYPSDEAHLH